MRVLLVQTSFLGDVILSTPVIAGIKRLHPQAEIWMMTTPQARDLVRADPLLAGTLVFDKRAASSGPGGLWRVAREIRSCGFERAYALQRSYRTALLLAFSGIPHRVGFSQARLSFLYHERIARPPDLHDVHRNLSILSAEAPLAALADDLRLFAPELEAPAPAVREIVDRAGGYAVIAPRPGMRRVIAK
jgi:heptosyltransferase II